jgi:hypothetical protein
MTALGMIYEALTRLDWTSTHKRFTSLGPSFVFRRLALLCTCPIFIATDDELLPSLEVEAPIPGPKVIEWDIDGSTGSAGSEMTSPGRTKVVMIVYRFYAIYVEWICLLWHLLVQRGMISARAN